jgi:hypothetical protein
MLVLGLSLAVVTSGCTASVNPEQAKAIAEIEKLAGKVIVDEKGPDKAMILVDLNGNEAADAGLGHLTGLPDLQRLNLAFSTVTDAGLGYLRGLTKLGTLDLANTEVTARGVEKLRQALPTCSLVH